MAATTCRRGSPASSGATPRSPRSRRLAAGDRLLTLTGAGGVGKTRLALRGRRPRAPGDFPDGVWLVELAALARPGAGRRRAVAAALGVREQRRAVRWSRRWRPPCAPRRLLLVLDNCEHLVAPAPRWSPRSCRPRRGCACWRPAASRCGVAGEVVWRVPSLPLPGRRGSRATGRAGGDRGGPAVRRAGARRASPAFALDERNARGRGRGLPPARRPAAGDRAGGGAGRALLTVEQIAARLDDALAPARRRQPDRLPRQQTLRATLDWSHELLAEPERAAAAPAVGLRRAAATLEAAEAVCGAPQYADRLDPAAVLDLLAALVDKSLVAATSRARRGALPAAGDVRQYARERLIAAGEEGVARSAHAAAVLAAAEAADGTVEGGPRAAGLAAAEAQLDSARAALAWFLERDDGERGLRLASALVWPWMAAGRSAESRRWFGQLLRLDAPTGVRARALLWTAGLAMLEQDPEEAERLGLASAALEPELRGPDAVWAWCAAEARLVAAVAAANRGDRDRARALTGEGLARLRRAGESSSWGAP